MTEEHHAKNDAQSIAEYGLGRLNLLGCTFANLRTFDTNAEYRFKNVAEVGAYDRHPDIVSVRGIGATGAHIAVRYGDWPSDDERRPILHYATAIGLAYLCRICALSDSTSPRFLEVAARYDAIDLATQSPEQIDATLESIARDLVATGEATSGTWEWIDPKPEPEPEDTLSDDLLLAVDDASFQELVLRAPGAVLVDFWAPWCGPCKRMTPLLKRLVQEHPSKIVVAKLNVDENAATKNAYDIKGIPRLLLFEDGRVVEDHLGTAPYPELVAKFVERAGG